MGTCAEGYDIERSISNPDPPMAERQVTNWKGWARGGSRERGPAQAPSHCSFSKSSVTLGWCVSAPPPVHGGVAQWQSRGLISPWSQVRIPPPPPQELACRSQQREVLEKCSPGLTTEIHLFLHPFASNCVQTGGVLSRWPSVLISASATRRVSSFMATSSSQVVGRFAKYTNLHPYIDQQWMAAKLADPWVSSWHPFLNGGLIADVVALDDAMGVLRQAAIQHTDDVARRLTSDAQENYNGARVELLIAAKLVQRGGYQVRFVPTSVNRTPDLEVQMPSGDVVGIECTAANRTWRYDLLRPLLSQRLSADNSHYTVDIESWTDLLSIDDAEIDQLVTDIRSYMQNGPYPIASQPGEFELRAGDGDLAVRVTVSPGPGPNYRISMGTIGAKFQPGLPSHVNGLWRRMWGELPKPGKPRKIGKRTQLANYQRGVLVVDLSHDSDVVKMMNIPVVGDHLWSVFGQDVLSKELQPQEKGLPPEIDALVFTFGREFGAQEGRFIISLASPKADWTRTLEGQTLLKLLASEKSAIAP